MNDVIETTAEVVPIIPTEQLAEINATDQGLAQLRSKATELAAMGVPQTKEQYDEVHRITMVSVKVRTESDKLSKRLAAPYKDRYDQIRAEGKRIGDHAAQSEAMTRPLKEQYEAEQERLKIEAEKAAAAKIQARVDSITKLGFAFDGAGYYAESFERFIDAIEVHALPDELWQELYNETLLQHEEYQAIVKHQREQAEAEAKRMQDRIHALSLLGFGFNGKNYSSLYSLDFHISPDEIKSLPDDKWDLLFDSAGARYNDYKSETERLQKRADEQRAEQKRLADERAKFEKEQAEFRAEQQRVADERIEAERQADQARLDTYHREAAEQQRIEQERAHAEYMAEQDRLQAEAEKQARAEAKELLRSNKERAARLKGDKKLMKVYVKRLADVILPTLEELETMELQARFSDELMAVLNGQLRDIDAL